MAFKALAALAALVVLTTIQPSGVNAFSVANLHGNLISRVPHSGLVRRAAEANSKTAKRCSKYRGSGPQKSTPSASTSAAVSVTPAHHTTHTSVAVHSDHNTPSIGTANAHNHTTTHITKTTSVTSKTTKPTSSKTPNKPSSTHHAAPTPVKPARSKVGMIFPASHPDFFRKAVNATNHKFYATYTWSVRKPKEVEGTGIDFIPTLPASGRDWDLVKRGYANKAFGCNEVNQAGQAKMSVEKGIALWKQYLSPLIAEGYTLCSHSISNAPSGPDWLEDFRDQCPECWDEVHLINLHFYSNKAEGMIDYLKDAHSRLNKPIIVTEFGCANFSGRGAVSDGCSPAEVKTFIEKTTAFMDSQDWIVAYMFFGAFTPNDPSGGVPSGNALFTSSGSFTENGRAYVY